MLYSGTNFQCSEIIQSQVSALWKVTTSVEQILRLKSLKKDFFFFLIKKNMDPSDRLPITVRNRELKRNRKFAIRFERRLSFTSPNNAG
jgi:hypothetical protein